MLSVAAYAAVCQCGFNESKKRESEKREREGGSVCIEQQVVCICVHLCIDNEVFMPLCELCAITVSACEEFLQFDYMCLHTAAK